jgi:dipeptidase E
MINANPKVIAIGGGGFTHAADPGMEDFILAQVPKARPRIGFIGTASHDDPLKIQRFHTRFNGICELASHLPMTAPAAEVQSWVDALDIVYVGGGDTLHLVTQWRMHGIDAVMLAAARRGVLMAGISAGASVWFEQALSDAGGAGLAPLRGIGLLAGSCCPHYSSEPLRRSAFPASIASGQLPDGIAIDDGVAVLIDASGAMHAFAARAGVGAYHVLKRGSATHSAPVTAALTA